MKTELYCYHCGEARRRLRAGSRCRSWTSFHHGHAWASRTVKESRELRGLVEAVRVWAKSK